MPAALLVAALAVFEWNTYHFRDLLSERMYGSRPHRVPCDELPTPDEVQRILDDNALFVERIEAINPGFISVEMNTFTCVDSADIRILYATTRDRERIRALLGQAEIFFGVPFNMQNH